MESSIARTETYKTFLARKSLSAFFMHAGLLVLYSLRVRRWNYTEHRTEESFRSIKGKGLFAEVLTKILEYCNIDLFSSFGPILRAEAMQSIVEMIEDKLASESIEILHNKYHRKSYKITQRGVHVFKAEIEPFLPEQLLSLGESIHLQQEAFQSGNANLVLTCLTGLVSVTPIQVRVGTKAGG